MTHARRMIETNPSQVPMDTEALVECIEACFDCAQACSACADACLGEGDIQMLAAASASTSTAPTCARPPARYCPARRRSMRTWRGRRLRPALWRAACAETSASSMRSTWSTAGCAPRPAGAARAPATTSSPRQVLKLRAESADIEREDQEREAPSGAASASGTCGLRARRCGGDVRLAIGKLEPRPAADRIGRAPLRGRRPPCIGCRPHESRVGDGRRS